MTEPIVVSAPGKVLLAGGYLVLDPAYSGLVISASSRFYTVVRDAPADLPNRILVRSPQFIGAEWKYSVNFNGNEVIVEEILDSAANRNKFVHYALQYTLKLASEYSASTFEEVLSHGLEILTIGDNDFYTQKREPGSPSPTIASLSEIPPFCPLNVPLSEVQKTGMGSSAALITSIVSALLLKFGVVSKEGFAQLDGRDRVLAHNTAQSVHCLAQGKVGSGFDVSAAVFGSHVYTRFDPKVLAPLMKITGDFANLALIPLQPILDPAVPVHNKPTWTSRVEPFQLPPLVRLVLADVAGGSSTPSLVRKVNEWRSNNPDDAKKLWSDIDASNKSLVEGLRNLIAMYKENTDAYEATVQILSLLQPVQWTTIDTEEIAKPVVQAFDKVFRASETTRTLMRKMGENAGVDIEPAAQTDLLDKSITQAGVIGGGVPGAGGDDAIWVLVLEPKNTTKLPLLHVERVWHEFKQRKVSPLLATESTEKGVRVEQFDLVQGLKQAVTKRDYATENL